MLSPQGSLRFLSKDTVDDAINILKKNDEELKDWINKEKNLGLLKKDDYTIVWVELND